MCLHAKLSQVALRSDESREQEHNLNSNAGLPKGSQGGGASKDQQVTTAEHHALLPARTAADSTVGVMDHRCITYAAGAGTSARAIRTVKADKDSPRGEAAAAPGLHLTRPN